LADGGFGRARCSLTLDGDSLYARFLAPSGRCATGFARRASRFRIAVVSIGFVTDAELPEQLAKTDKRAQHPARLDVISSALLPAGDFGVEGLRDRVEQVGGVSSHVTVQLGRESFEDSRQWAQ
jgi:hypothetical protein